MKRSPRRPTSSSSLGQRQTLEAAWPLLAAVSQKRSTPVVGLGIGRGGLAFSLLGRKYGSPGFMPALEKGMEAFPGQPTVGDLDDIYRWRQIGPKTRFFGIAGTGTFEQHLSIVLNTAFHQLNMETRCLPFDVRSVDSLVKAARHSENSRRHRHAGCLSELSRIIDKSDDVAEQSGHADLYIKASRRLARAQLDLEDGAAGLGKQNSAANRPKIASRSPQCAHLGCGGIGKSVAAGIKKRYGLVSIAAGDDDSAQKAAGVLSSAMFRRRRFYETLVDVVVFRGEFRSRQEDRRHQFVVTAARHGGDGFERTPETVRISRSKRKSGLQSRRTARCFHEYAATLFKSLTGQDLPSESGGGDDADVGSPHVKAQMSKQIGKLSDLKGMVSRISSI